MNTENYNELTKEELISQLVQAKRKNDELERAKRRVGISFRRVPESGSQITRLFNGDFPFLQHIPSLSYTLSDRHTEEKTDGKELSKATDGNTTLIEADNLAALALLQLTHHKKVDVIYIDPPYNTGNNDFIYNDARKSSITDIKGASVEEYAARLDGKSRSVGRDDPERHSLWLSFMEKRLYLAKELLSDDGVIFASIDDNEQAKLKLLMDEIFGEQNFVANLIWKKKQGGGNDSSNFVTEHEYVLVFSKSEKFSSNLDSGYILDEKQYPFEDELGKYSLIRLDKPSLEYTPSLDFPITGPDGVVYLPRIVNEKKTRWRWGKNKVETDFDKLVFKNGGVFTKAYMPILGIKPKSLMTDTRYGRSETGNDDLKRTLGHRVFSFPKPVMLIKHLLNVSAHHDSIILDFFAGSGTTAQAVAELNKEDGGNRQCILVTHGDENGKNIAEDVTAERIKRVLSGKNWADGKTHEGLPGELNYYKLAFTPKINNSMKAVETMQSKFVGLAALQQDVTLNDKLSGQPSNYVVLTSSTKVVVVVKNEEYLLDDFESLSEYLEQLKTFATKYEENFGIHKELIIYVPSETKEDEYGFSEQGWEYIPFPLEYLEAHSKLIDRMKKNETLLPPVQDDEQAETEGN